MPEAIGSYQLEATLSQTAWGFSARAHYRDAPVGGSGAALGPGGSSGGWLIRGCEPVGELIHRADAQRAQSWLLAAARFQQGLGGLEHGWMKVQDSGLEGGIAYSVRPYAPLSVRQLVQMNHCPTPAALHTVIGCVVDTLSRLDARFKRPHGNLHVGNVLLVPPGLDQLDNPRRWPLDLTEWRAVLTDPLPDAALLRGLDQEAERRALGALIHEWVCGRAPDKGWPLARADEWSRLGAVADAWFDWCNALLKPSADDALANDAFWQDARSRLDSALVPPPEPSRRKMVLPTAAVLLIGLGAAGYFGFRAMNPPAVVPEQSVRDLLRVVQIHDLWLGELRAELAKGSSLNNRFAQDPRLKALLDALNPGDRDDVTKYHPLDPRHCVYVSGEDPRDYLNQLAQAIDENGLPRTVEDQVVVDAVQRLLKDDDRVQASVFNANTIITELRKLTLDYVAQSQEAITTAPRWQQALADASGQAGTEGAVEVFNPLRREVQQFQEVFVEQSSRIQGLATVLSEFAAARRVFTNAPVGMTMNDTQSDLAWLASHQDALLSRVPALYTSDLSTIAAQLAQHPDTDPQVVFAAYAQAGEQLQQVSMKTRKIRNLAQTVWQDQVDQEAFVTAYRDRLYDQPAPGWEALDLWHELVETPGDWHRPEGADPRKAAAEVWAERDREILDFFVKIERLAPRSEARVELKGAYDQILPEIDQLKGRRWVRAHETQIRAETDAFSVRLKRLRDNTEVLFASVNKPLNEQLAEVRDSWPKQLNGAAPEPVEEAWVAAVDRLTGVIPTDDEKSKLYGFRATQAMTAFGQSVLAFVDDIPAPAPGDWLGVEGFDKDVAIRLVEKERGDVIAELISAAGFVAGSDETISVSLPTNTRQSIAGQYAQQIRQAHQLLTQLDQTQRLLDAGHLLGADRVQALRQACDASLIASAVSASVRRLDAWLGVKNTVSDQDLVNQLQSQLAAPEPDAGLVRVAIATLQDLGWPKPSTTLADANALLEPAETLIRAARQRGASAPGWAAGDNSEFASEFNLFAAYRRRMWERYTALVREPEGWQDALAAANDWLDLIPGTVMDPLVPSWPDPQLEKDAAYALALTQYRSALTGLIASENNTVTAADSPRVQRAVAASADRLQAFAQQKQGDRAATLVGRIQDRLQEKAPDTVEDMTRVGPHQSEWAEKLDAQLMPDDPSRPDLLHVALFSSTRPMNLYFRRVQPTGQEPPAWVLTSEVDVVLVQRVLAGLGIGPDRWCRLAGPQRRVAETQAWTPEDEAIEPPSSWVSGGEGNEALSPAASWFNLVKWAERLQLAHTDTNGNPLEGEDRKQAFVRGFTSGKISGGSIRPYPINTVSPQAAIAFGALLGCRLPTEHEWRAALETATPVQPNLLDVSHAKAEQQLDATYRLAQANFRNRVSNGIDDDLPPKPVGLRVRGLNVHEDQAVAAAANGGYDDGQIWFRPVRVSADGFTDLVGNVNEFFLHENWRKDAFSIRAQTLNPSTWSEFLLGGSDINNTDLTNALRRMVPYLKVGGGSAFDPRATAGDTKAFAPRSFSSDEDTQKQQAAVRQYGDERPDRKSVGARRNVIEDLVFSDVGFRLAFTAGPVPLDQWWAGTLDRELESLASRE